MSRNRLAAATAAVLVTLAAAACTIANTTPQNIGISYNNGPFDSRSFEKCDPPGNRSIDGAGSDHYYYPAGQRTFNFSSDRGADSKPLSVATSSSIELVASGTVTFHLNTSCEEYTDKSGKKWPGGRMQKFHAAGREDGADEQRRGGELAGWDQRLPGVPEGARDQRGDQVRQGQGHPGALRLAGHRGR
jgi:hypothetical protein